MTISWQLKQVLLMSHISCLEKFYSDHVIIILYCSEQADEDEGLTAVADYIQQNNVPIPFLLMLFAHFMSMVADRLL